MLRHRHVLVNVFLTAHILKDPLFHAKSEVKESWILVLGAIAYYSSK